MLIPATGISIWIIFKIFALVLLGMYLVFAFVMVKQVQLMTNTLQLGFELPVKILSYIHFCFAAFVFLAALIIL